MYVNGLFTQERGCGQLCSFLVAFLGPQTFFAPDNFGAKLTSQLKTLGLREASDMGFLTNETRCQHPQAHRSRHHCYGALMMSFVIQSYAIQLRAHKVLNGREWAELARNSHARLTSILGFPALLETRRNSSESFS